VKNGILYIKTLQFSTNSREILFFEKKNTLSLEVILRQGWVSNVCPQWCWIIRTVHIATYLCIHKYVYIHSKIHIPKYLYAQVAAKLPLCAEISQMYFKPKDIMNMPYISTNEPHISAKEPYICAKVPNTSAKEPSVDTICSPRYAEYTTRASFKKKE